MGMEGAHSFLQSRAGMHARGRSRGVSIALGNLLGERGLGMIWGLVTLVGLSCGQ